LTQDDALYRFRLRALALAAELGNVCAACRAMGSHPSTFYRWRGQVLRFGPEILRPRERRRPKMANQTSPFIEQRVLAFCLGHPGFGPMRISAKLRRPKWGGIVISANGIHRVLRRHGLNTRAKLKGAFIQIMPLTWDSFLLSIMDRAAPGPRSDRFYIGSGRGLRFRT
jgi:hypothetical protein